MYATLLYFVPVHSLPTPFDDFTTLPGLYLPRQGTCACRYGVHHELPPEAQVFGPRTVPAALVLAETVRAVLGLAQSTDCHVSCGDPRRLVAQSVQSSDLMDHRRLAPPNRATYLTRVSSTMTHAFCPWLAVTARHKRGITFALLLSACHVDLSFCTKPHELVLCEPLSTLVILTKEVARNPICLL